MRAPIKLTSPKLIKSSDTIKKGSSEGNTIFHQVLSPMVAPAKTSAGWDTMLAANTMAQAVQKSPDILPGLLGGAALLADRNRAPIKAAVMARPVKDN
jgi:hypothetical protein